MNAQKTAINRFAHPIGGKSRYFKGNISRLVIARLDRAIQDFGWLLGSSPRRTIQFKFGDDIPIEVRE